MKRLISFLAIVMVLTACQPSVEGQSATSTAMPTATVEVPPSATSTSTPQPTAVATATAEQTATPDFSEFAGITPALELNLAKLEKLPLVDSSILLNPDGTVSDVFNAWIDQLSAAGKLNDFPDGGNILFLRVPTMVLVPTDSRSGRSRRTKPR